MWETSIGCLHQGPNLQLRYVPWLGIKPSTFWCVGWCSNQLSHLARAHLCLFNLCLVHSYLMFQFKYTICYLFSISICYITFIPTLVERQDAVKKGVSSPVVDADSRTHHSYPVVWEARSWSTVPVHHSWATPELRLTNLLAFHWTL